MANRAMSPDPVENDPRQADWRSNTMKLRIVLSLWLLCWGPCNVLAWGPGTHRDLAKKFL
jgi:hypothetical protein